MQEAKLNNNKESTETGFASKELIKNLKEQIVESICHKGGAGLPPALKVR